MGRKKTPASSKPFALVILDRIGNGESLLSICREKGMPSWRTVYDWVDKDEDYAAGFACARVRGCEAIALKALEIADTPLVGEEEKFVAPVIDPEGKVQIPGSREVKRGDMLGHRKLQVETRLKLLACWDPKRYGNKQEIEHKGSMAIGSMSDDQIREELASMVAMGVIPLSAVPDAGSSK